MRAAVKRYFVCIITVISCLMIFTPALAENAEYVYNKDTVSEVWSFEKTKGDITPGDSGFETTTYDAVVKALYTGEKWADNYTYKLVLNGKSAGNDNYVYVYFNYQDEKNYYYFSVTSPKVDNVITLYSVINGKSTVLGTYDNYSINYTDTEFFVKYNNGNIRITASKSGISTDIFDVNDANFSYGQVGFGTYHCKAVIKNIQVYGEKYNEYEASNYLSVKSIGMENGAKNVPVKGSLDIMFNGALRSETVNKENIVMTGPEGFEYDVSSDNDILTVTWDSLEYNSEYLIVLGGGLLLNETGLGFKSGSYTFTFFTPPSENYIDYVYDMRYIDNDWSFTNKSYFTISENGMKTTDYSASAASILNAYSWYDEYVYSASLNNRSSNVSNKMILYFNYRGPSDYYAVSVGGAQSENTVELYKMENGEKSLIDSYDNYIINYQTAVFVITYKSGRIFVTAEKGSTKTDIFDVDGETSYGCVGIGLSNCSGVFENISVRGNGTDYHLRISESNVENNEQNVPPDTELEFVFSENFDVKDVVKTHVRIFADDEALSDEEYTLMVGSNQRILRIIFSGTLKQKTEYTIMFSPDFASKSNGVGLSFEECVFKFKTQPPMFDVEVSAECESEIFESLSECAGKYVDFNVKLDNNSGEEQNYQLTVAAVAENGKTLAIKYYCGNIPAYDGKLHKDSLLIPSETENGAKLVYFVWDGYKTMNILYPSGEF